ncbi:glycosyltransferase family 2 protein [Haliea sp. E1-2-M8]|uniref:glycosyltransferase family 2 protein n=1 Tax=Haliea sp. E1-2-M8 TaxID=3064706 RepID=UPI0027197698|nr:glycosyltransferase family 2 protein [Haliea sp. E1-2-M8]MDO8862168.1 glycosyltransferase family 2 protein [Haliea sp. E1-2-M8]
MSASPAPLPALCVSVVLYHSDLLRLEETLGTLLRAVRDARSAGQLGAVTLALIDNSVCGDYHRSLQQHLGRQSWAESAVSLEVLEMPVNAGYGAGHNEALQHHAADIHLILNPDVATASDALRQGLEYLRNQPQVALVCPRGEAGDGSPAYLSKRLPTVLVLVLRAFAPARVQRLFAARLARYEMHDLHAACQPAAVPLASGCFMLVRGSALQAVGGFDERYFLYFEDFDLSLRLAGQGAVEYLPGMLVRHYGGGSAGKGWRHRWWFLRSGVRFFNDHGWRWF